MKKLGILIKTLGVSQQGFFLIKNGNALCKKYPNTELMVFYNDHDRLLSQTLFSMFLYNSLWGYRGAVIATDIESAYLLSRCPSPNKKYFYIWNLEWIYDNYNFEELNDIYKDDKIELIARSEWHSNIIESCWKKPICIMEDFNYEQLNKFAI